MKIYLLSFYVRDIGGFRFQVEGKFHIYLKYSENSSAVLKTYKKYCHHLTRYKPKGHIF